MKIQDAGFFVMYIVLLASRKLKLFVWAGLVCLLLAMPLFAKWVFFTAERLVWYATGFFLTYIVVLTVRNYKRE
jgi:hypothetical protein